MTLMVKFGINTDAGFYSHGYFCLSNIEIHTLDLTKLFGQKLVHKYCFNSKK
jgi:hypothetical protein